MWKSGDVTRDAFTVIRHRRSSDTQGKYAESERMVNDAPRWRKRVEWRSVEEFEDNSGKVAAY